MTLRITRESIICGVSAMKLREVFLRLDTHSLFGEGYLGTRLSLSPPEENSLLSALLAGGYITEREAQNEADRRWSLTPKGIEVRNATALRPIPRQKAFQVLEGVLVRARRLHEESYWLWEVEELVVFGSYLDPERELLGDIDIGYRLTPKEALKERHHELEEERRKVLEGQPRYRSYLDWLCSPEIEVRRMLLQGTSGRRNPYLAHHALEEVQRMGCPFRLLYAKPTQA